jgi:hypothetical protein
MKTISKKALAREASFWASLKKVIQENPGKTCHK